MREKRSLSILLVYIFVALIMMHYCQRANAFAAYFIPSCPKEWGEQVNGVKVGIYLEGYMEELLYKEPVYLVMCYQNNTDKYIAFSDLITEISGYSTHWSGLLDVQIEDEGGNILKNDYVDETNKYVANRDPGDMRLNRNEFSSSIPKVEAHDTWRYREILNDSYYNLKPGNYTIQIIASKWKDKDGNVLKSNKLNMRISDVVYAETPPEEKVDGLSFDLGIDKQNIFYDTGDKVEIDTRICGSPGTSMEYSLPGGFFAQELMLYNNKGEEIPSEMWKKTQQTDRIPLERTPHSKLDKENRCDYWGFFLTDYYPDLKPGAYFVQMRWKILHDGSEKFIRSSKQKIIILPPAEEKKQ